MTAHTQTPQLDRWIAAVEGISHINMDLSCWWVKTKETFTCFFTWKNLQQKILLMKMVGRLHITATKELVHASNTGRMGLHWTGG